METILNGGSPSPSSPGPGDETAARSFWEGQAAAVVRKSRRLGADEGDDAVWTALTRTTIEDIPIPPLGLPDGVVIRSDGRREGSSGGWQNRSQIVDPDPSEAAETAVDEWQNDADSIWITVGAPGVDPAALGRVLGRIPLDLVPVVLTAAGATSDVQAAQAFHDILRRRELPAAEGGSLGGDPIGRMMRLGDQSPGAAVDAVTRDLGALATALGIGALVADGTPAHTFGAGDAGEIGYLLACAVHYLRLLESFGYDVPAALALLEFRVAATDEQFVTIAKMRALQVLLRRLADLCGAPGFTPRIHAVTSSAMMTRYDPWTNLLRTTVAAFSAGVGGADVITVRPFDAAIGVPNAQGRRLARNISALLIQEAHVADVRDPAGGSWAVEALTDRVADAAWTRFQQIEAEGGIVRAIDSRSLAVSFSATRDERNRRIRHRRQAITGISEFPLVDEKLLVRRPYQAAPSGDLGDEAPDDGATWSADFEALRDAPVTDSVFLATLGPLAAHAGRAGFVNNVLASCGVPVISAGPTGTVDDVLLAYRSAPSGVVCLVGKDAAYAELGADLIAALRAAGANRVLLAGRPSAALTPLVDDDIAAGDDVLTFGLRTRQALSVDAEPEAVR